LQTLAQAAAAPPLSKLVLDNVGLNTETARALAPWPGLSGVRDLSLSSNRLDAHGLRALLFSPQHGPIRSLDLLGNPLGNLGARVLARWPGLASIRRLVLHGCAIDDEGAQALLEALPTGVEIDLSDNPVSDNVLDAFRSRHRLAE
jgi:Ran GTPase-activating protein (RanGAP) involved in mRNA processing and transport